MLATVGCGKSADKTTGRADAKMLNLTLVDVNNNTVDLSDHLGKVVIVDFWDTWCGPCKREIPHFVELYEEYQPQGLEIVGVAFARQGPLAVKKFSERYNINYACALMNEDARRLYGSPPSIPTTYIINQKGEISEKVVGYRPKEFFEQKIRALLDLS
jgi:thiol-disulfide isomerase/thioredoxin